MGAYSTGQAERLLGLPASTLRHWERELGILAPRRDDYGRRLYSESDLRLLLRLRHLVQRRSLGLPAARDAVLAELGGPAEPRAALAQLRGELISLFFASEEARSRLDRGPSPPA